MERYLIMCRSLTYAQRATRILERTGLSSSVARTPHGIGGDGCSYGVRLRTVDIRAALSALRKADVKIGAVYIIGEDGSIRELPT